MRRPERAPDRFRGHFLRAPADREPYAGAAGVLRALPRAVAVPLDADDVAELARWATEHRLPLVPRGAGTGMPGGNVGEGIAVDLVSCFRGLGTPDPAARRVRAEPGITPDQLNAACAPAGLHLPVDPSSGARCCLGGMLANNAAGAHSVKYGATRAWVHALDLVLADGTRATLTRGEAPREPRLQEILGRVDHLLRPDRDLILAAWPRVRKNSSGYALREYLESGDGVDLLVGSEGTLALIVGAEMRLAPAPAARGVALVELRRLEAVGPSVQALLPLRPATCEMLDRTFLELVRGSGADPGIPLLPGLEAVLLVEMEGNDPDEVVRALRRAEQAVAPHAARVSLATAPEEQRAFWQLRHAASPIIARLAGRRVSMQFIEDGVVPIERLPDYVDLLRHTLREHDLPAVIFGHAGDGNLHVNPLVDVSRPDWRHTVETVLEQVAGGVARLGGTLAGEHGDGRLRAPLLETTWGTEMVERFRAVKHAFDPLGILNPGVVLPLPGQRPLDLVKDFAPA